VELLVIIPYIGIALTEFHYIAIYHPNHWIRAGMRSRAAVGVAQLALNSPTIVEG
jgi:hypothetical protein